MKKMLVVLALGIVLTSTALAVGDKVGNPGWFGVTVVESEPPCDDCVLRMEDLVITVRPKVELIGDLYSCPIGPVLVVDPLKVK